MLKFLTVKINFMLNFLPKNLKSLFKYIAEFIYWYIRDIIEGKDAFIREESLKKIHLRYCNILRLNKNTFKDKIVVDIGCGPKGSLHYFNAKLKIGIDPLINVYKEFFKLNNHKMLYINSKAENIPLEDEFVDFVISENALDHVDNFRQTIMEIYRILKPEGKIIFQINYRRTSTVTEPIILNYKVVNEILQKYFNFQIKEHLISHHGSSKSVLVN